MLKLIKVKKMARMLLSFNHSPKTMTVNSKKNIFKFLMVCGKDNFETLPKSSHTLFMHKKHFFMEKKLN